MQLQEKIFGVDLGGHPDPGRFLKRMQEYPDENVKFDLEGKKLRVRVNGSLPTQIIINIFSYVQARANEEIYFQ